MKSSVWLTWTAALSAAAILILNATPATGAHAMTEANFLAHYEQNAQREAELLIAAKPLMSSSAVTAQDWSALTTLNAQIANLYVAREALSGQESLIASVITHPGATANLLTEQAALQGTIGTEVTEAKSGSTGKAKQVALRKQILEQRKQLKKIEAQIGRLRLSAQNWRNHPLTHSLAQIDTSILQLQAAAITCATDLIAQAGTSSGVSTATQPSTS